MSTTQPRQPAGGPTGGEFTTNPKAEPEVALAPCTPLGFVPQDLTGSDVDELTALRRGVYAKLDRARFVLDGADHDRQQSVDLGRDELAKVDAAEKEAETQLNTGIADLERISAVLNVGRMSRDSMTPAQRDLVDGVHRHAYDYADAAVGGMVLATRDEAEEFAGYVVQCLIRSDFDESSLSNQRLLRDFDRERAGRLAGKTVAGADQKAWVARMASTAGISTSAAGRSGAYALSSLANTLNQTGFFVERDVTLDGATFKLTGGRPLPVQDVT